jgi:hypothetical protein
MSPEMTGKINETTFKTGEYLTSYEFSAAELQPILQNGHNSHPRRFGAAEVYHAPKPAAAHDAEAKRKLLLVGKPKLANSKGG